MMRVTYRRRERGPLAAELAQRRKAKGWTQRQLADAAGVGRTAVQYWERAGWLDPTGGAVQRMAEALGWPLASLSGTDARDMGCNGDTIRARGDGVLSWRDTHARGGGQLCQTNTRARRDGQLSAAMQAMAERQLAAFKAREAERAKTRRVICGAKTRKGRPCRNKSEPGKRRCKFHGGMSTGARTPEGIERIREAQRRRWAKARQERQG